MQDTFARATHSAKRGDRVYCIQAADMTFTCNIRRPALRKIQKSLGADCEADLTYRAAITSFGRDPRIEPLHAVRAALKLVDYVYLFVYKLCLYARYLCSRATIGCRLLLNDVLANQWHSGYVPAD